MQFFLDSAKVDEIEYAGGSRIRLRVATDRPAVLVLSESAYPGWEVYVNGEEQKVLWLNFFFQGVEMAAGQHEVEFVYRPRNFSLYVGLSMASLAMLWLVRRVVLTGLPFRGKV